MVETLLEECVASDEFIVITGIRHPGEAKYLKESIRNFFLVGITAEADQRYQRRQDDGETESRQEFDELDERDQGHPDRPYGQNIGGCIDLARREVYGFIVENTTLTKRDLRNEVDQILSRISERLGQI